VYGRLISHPGTTEINEQSPSPISNSLHFARGLRFALFSINQTAGNELPPASALKFN
jgi:hypothetical protein